MSLEKDVQKILSEVTQKKTEYGNIDAKVTELLCAIRPNGFNPNEFDTFLLVSKLAEKLFRFSSENISKERKRDALVDLMGYALLGLHNTEQQELKELHGQEVVDRIHNLQRAAQEGIEAAMAERGVTLGTPPSLEERIEKLFKTHVDLTIDDIAKLIEPSKFSVEQVKQVVQSMFLSGMLQYIDENKTYQLIEEDVEVPEKQKPEEWKVFASEVKKIVTEANEPYETVGDPQKHLDKKLLEYITKFPGKSPRELETVGAAYLGYKRKPVAESLQHLLATGKVIMSDSLKVVPNV